MLILPAVGACSSPAPAPTVTETEFRTATPAPVTTPPSPTPLSENALSRSVAQVVQYDGDRQTCGSGSGTIVTSSGLVLTNFHVVRPAPGCDNPEIGLAFSDDPSLAPQMRYSADVMAFDPDLDLAVLRPAAAADGSDVPEVFPAVEIGDSDDLALGDAIRILGFPALGGSTITSTHGAVSGFRDQGDLHRAWIKTDTTVVGGNSGGLVINDAGQMVGVPTRASASDSGDIADCREAQDTNHDGVINDDDQCVPLGGFLSLIRPVALATALIREAERADPIPLLELLPDSDPSEPEPHIAGAGFGSGLDENGRLLQPGPTLPSGPDRVCARLVFEGMSQGMSWGYVWSHDGSPVASATLEDLSWTQASELTGSLCAGIENGQGVKDGLWDLAIHLADPATPLFTTSVFVGGVHPIVEVHFAVQAGRLCEINAVPTGASGWQENLLEEETSSSGDSFSLAIPAGTYNIRAVDCGGKIRQVQERVVLAQGVNVLLG